MADPGLPNIKEDWKQNDTLNASDFNKVADRVNAVEDDIADDLETGDLQARLFVQQADPETTMPGYTGPAVWYKTDGAGNVIGKKVRGA